MKAIFLDIETTGLDPYIHKPIDIALKVFDLQSGATIGSYESVIKQSASVWEDHDPVSIEINGYQWEQVSQGKEPAQVKIEIIQLFRSLNIQRGEAVFICQNPAFDRSFFVQIIDVYTQERLNWPYHWLDLASMYWALLSTHLAKQAIPFPENISLSKNSIAKAYNLTEETYPHRAMQGVDHLMATYLAVLSQQPKAPTSGQRFTA